MSDEPRIRLEDSGTVVSEYWYDQSTGETVVESESGETYRFANDGTLDTPALSTESLSNAKYASAFGGANGGEQIQNAIDAANAEAGPNVVIVDGLGPDDVSDSTGSISGTQYAENAWKLTQHLSIPSYTSLVFVGCYVFLADGADDNLVRNSDFTNGNTHIGLKGIGWPVFDGNGSNQTTYDRGTADGLKNIGFRFYQIDNTRIDGLYIRNTNAWGARLEDVRDSAVTNIRWDQSGDIVNQDGCKIEGPARRVTQANHIGTTGDDMVSVQDFGVELMDGSGGDVQNISFENITRQQSRAGNAVRVLQESNYVANIKVSNVSSRKGEAAVTLGYIDADSTANNFERIAISNVVGDGCDGVHINQGGNQIAISNVTTYGDALRMGGGHTVGRLTATNLDAQLTAVSIGDFELANGNISNVTAPGEAFISTTSDTAISSLKASHFNGYLSNTGTGFDLNGSISGLHITDVLVRNADYAIDAVAGTSGYVNDFEVVQTQTATYNGLGNLRFGGSMPPLDVRNLSNIENSKAYHDGSGTNTVGPAFNDGSGWTSLVDGTTIS